MAHSSETQKALSVPRVIQAYKQSKPVESAPQQTIAPPVITKFGTEYHLSMPATSKQQPRKVEYYAGNTLIGAAFTSPYRVTVDSSMLNGAQQITAKIYTDIGSAMSPPAIVQPGSAVPSTTTDDAPVLAQTNPPSDQSQTTGTQTNTRLTVPQNVRAGLSDDRATVAVQWDPVLGAASYQIWRNNVLQDTVADTSYADTAVQSGQTYDYQIAAVDASGTISDLSAIAVVTTPSKQPTYQLQMPSEDSSAPTPKTTSDDTTSVQPVSE